MTFVFTVCTSRSDLEKGMDCHPVAQVKKSSQIVMEHILYSLSHLRFHA